MPRPDFSTVELALLGAGISARHVRRTVLELNDHFDDLVDAEMHRGLDQAGAERVAAHALGDFQDLVCAMRARPELRSWAFRYPGLAMVIYPLAYIALLPAVPIAAGMAHAALLGRWAASALLSGILTATILLVLQLSIVLT